MFEQVYKAAALSVDPRTKIGCVVEYGSHGLIAAYNDIVRPDEVVLGAIRTDKEFKKHVVEHAEILALRAAERLGKFPQIHTLWVNEIPCESCTRTIVNSPISKVILHKWWLVHRDDYGPSPVHQLEQFRFYMSVFDKIVEVDDQEIEVMARRDDMDFMPNGRING